MFSLCFKHHGVWGPSHRKHSGIWEALAHAKHILVVSMCGAYRGPWCLTSFRSLGPRTAHSLWLGGFLAVWDLGALAPLTPSIIQPCFRTRVRNLCLSVRYQLSISLVCVNQSQSIVMKLSATSGRFGKGAVCGAVQAECKRSVTFTLIMRYVQQRHVSFPRTILSK